MYTRSLFPKFNSAVLFQKKTGPGKVVAEDEAFHQAYAGTGQSHQTQINEPRQNGAITQNPAATGSALLFLTVASGFMMLALVATTFYYLSKKRSQGSGILRSGPKVLLLNRKDQKIPGLQEKSFLISSFQQQQQSSPTQPGRTKAVRSPSSGQVNPFSKKTPSPTGPLVREFPSAALHEETGKSSSEINNNSDAHHQPQPLSQQALTNNGKLLGKSGKMQSLARASLDSLSEVPPKDPLQDSGISSTGLASGKKDSVDSGVVANLGKLHFKLKYSYEKRALWVVIIRATDLPTPKDGSHHGSMDPYVKMQLLPEKQHKAKTRVLRKTQNPIYNEEFTFYGVTPNLLESLVVHFVVLNFDRFSRDEILGEVVCKMNQFEFDSLEKQITLVRDIAPRGNKLKIQELGELLVSLCYQPIANRLTVVILKARNLPKMDLTGLCDPYVKIYLFHNNQRLFKKRTHVKKRTLSPVFNESFVFDIPPEEGLDNVQMQLLVYDHDRVTRNELIGKIDLACLTGCPSTEKHWNEVIKSPRRQIAEWHKLKEC